MKKFFFIIIILSLVVSNNIIVQAKDNIAFIDLNIVFDNSNAGKKINKEIEGKKKKNNKSFKELQKKLKIDKEKLINQKNVPSKEEYEKKLVNLEKDLKKYNLDIRDKNANLTKFQLQVRKKFFDELRPILEDYAKENSIDIILKKEHVLIGKTNLDISKNILEIFNKKVKKITIE